MDAGSWSSLLLALVGLGVILKGVFIVRKAGRVPEDAVLPREEQIRAARQGALLFYVVGGLLATAPFFVWLFR